MIDNEREIIISTDEHLDEMNKITTQLKENVSSITNSIDNQNKIVKKISKDMEKSQNKMNYVNQKLSKILKTTDNKKLFTVIILFLVIIFQIFLLAFT